MIQQQAGRFQLDLSRVAYLRYLRRERGQSPRTEADADHVKLKTEMLQLRLVEARRELVSREAHEAMIEQMAGVVLTKLGGWPARIAGADLSLRRRAEAMLCAPTLPTPVPAWMTKGRSGFNSCVGGSRITTLICVKRPYGEAAVLSANWTSGPATSVVPGTPSTAVSARSPSLCHSSRTVTSNASPG